MRNYLDDLLTVCKSDPGQFDELFPKYLGKTLFEIPEIEHLVRAKSEFRSLLHFYKSAVAEREFYYARINWYRLPTDELETISDKIKKGFQKIPINETIFFKIGPAVNKELRQINVAIERRFDKHILPGANMSVEITVNIQLTDRSEYTLQTTDCPKWNGTEYEYFVL